MSFQTAGRNLLLFVWSVCLMAHQPLMGHLMSKHSFLASFRDIFPTKYIAGNLFSNYIFIFSYFDPSFGVHSLSIVGTLTGAGQARPGTNNN